MKKKNIKYKIQKKSKIIKIIIKKIKNLKNVAVKGETNNNMQRITRLNNNFLAKNENPKNT